MIQKLDEFDDADNRVVDYSDPAQIPHETVRPYRRNDTGGFVAAGVAVAMVIVGGFVYAGYLTENIDIHPRASHTVAAAGTQQLPTKDSSGH
ncbi:MAG TPA: hypothetical protein VFJ18_03485 [Pararhizobium sp.]|nr:hypothetical protein [Pararhizobium sp.]